MTEQQGRNRGSLAILMADIHGYARLMGKNEEETFQRVGRAIGLIKQLASDYGGEVNNVAGDGVLALFKDAPQALRFAIEMQREFLNDSVWTSASAPLAFRIGINIGEVLEDELGVQGHAVNVASRIQTIAQPGGICISAAVSNVVGELEGISLKSLGHPAMKNIDEKIEIFAVEREGLKSAGMQVFPTPSRSLFDQSHRPDSSIAVMQLENLTGEIRNDHLCKGVTGDIINNLTRFHDLHVIAQRSSSIFHGTHTEGGEIGQKLGVHYLTTGEFRQFGDKIRLQMRLAEADSGRVIWSERFDGDIGDIFEFQDEVTSIVASQMSIKIDAAERNRQRTAAPSDLQAYGLILRGRDIYRQRRRELNLHARRLFEQASTVDPNYAPSYVGISRMSNDAWRFNWVDQPGEALDDAIVKAQTAIRLEPDEARAHSALGNAFLYKREHDASMAAYERAISINPNDADILAEMGHSASVNDETERAVTLIKRAMRLNPFYPDWYLWHLGEAYFDMGDYEQSISTLNRMHDKTDAYRMLAASCALLDRMDDARRYADQILVTHPEFTIKHWANVPPDKNPEPRARLIDGLKKAGLS